MLILHIMAKSLEEDQERELNAPKTSIEEYDYCNRFSEVLFRLLPKIGWRWIKLTGRHCYVLIKTVLAKLP